MQLEIRKLTVDDLPEIEANLLPINKEEIMAMRGQTATELFDSNPDLMENTEILVIDGEIVCLGGSMESPQGNIVWLFGTDKIEKNKRHFAKVISDRFEEMKRKCDLLYSYVYEKNELTKNWLKMMDFKIFEGEQIGKNGEIFHYFEWRKPCV